MPTSKTSQAHQLELALAHEVRRPEEQVGAGLPRGAAPGLEGLQSGFHGRPDFGCAGFLVKTDDLRGMRRVDRFMLLGSLDATAADDEVILASELVADLLDRSAHPALVFRVRPVDRRLVDKLLGDSDSNVSVGVDAVRLAGGMGQCSHKCFLSDGVVAKTTIPSGSETYKF